MGIEMHRKRKGGRGRFPIQPKIGRRPRAEKMTPEPSGAMDPIHIDLAEAEVLRLVDLEGLYQEQAGREMGCSRGTIWRLLASAREKVTRSIYEGRPLVIGLQLEEDT
ncbi:MAG: hypothetical protein AM326_04175 [Candidatus Thorarchaeota archaeon SMTZ-45]|nr:MAG: hypothetical protein AM326_04175 [Candidatus Thorarchaeota archaeon SMTZ-45]KXH72585.1 MAG: hypothetical protein AM325_00715 [Candidatus Thorarchaeota archaeon SMTZ1-45]